MVAGAGSGKTRVLTYRIAHLIRDLRVAPDSILAITFTNKAANEMRGRVGALVGGAVRSMWVSTFHSACVRILRREVSRLGYRSSFSIYDEADSVRLINLVLKDLDLDSKRFPPKAMKAVISKSKNELVDFETFADQGDGFYHEQVADIYRLYQQRLLEASAMDFDDLLMVTVELFGAFPDVLAQYQNRFRYVLVDEYQDTNRAQYVLVKQLTAVHRNLCVVGDSDQSIYRFRGADIRNITDFEKDYPDARIIVLDQNYRSTETILDAANSVIANNTKRTPKNLWSDKGRGVPIIRYEGEDEHDEAGYVVDEIERLKSAGHNLSDVAVFYRTNAMSRVIEDVFVRRGLPYTVVGSVKFYDRKEIKDAVAYLRSIVNPSDEVSVKRIINEPRRGIGDTTIAHVDRFTQTQRIAFFDGLRRAAEIHQLNARAQSRGRRVRGDHGSPGGERCRRWGRGCGSGRARRHRDAGHSRGREDDRGHGKGGEPPGAGGCRHRVRECQRGRGDRRRGVRLPGQSAQARGLPRVDCAGRRHRRVGGGGRGGHPDDTAHRQGPGVPGGVHRRAWRTGCFPTCARSATRQSSKRSAVSPMSGSPGPRTAST